jgi:ABC-type Fe3+ transport system substrate-binding protein
MKALHAFLLGLALLWPGAAAAAAKEDWEKVVAAAKAEGQVTVYVYQFEAVFEAFHKAYPQIKVLAVTGTGNQLANRLLAERRADKYLADVFSGGVSTNFNVLYQAKALDSLRAALMLPEALDESKWYEGRHSWADPEKQFVFAYLANVYSGQLHYNTALVNAKEFDSYWDVLEPKWKGKLLSLDPNLTGVWGPLRLFYHHPALGPAYVKKFFGSMDIRLARDDRQITDWLAQEKFAICLACKDAPRAKSQGLPVESFNTNAWKEGGAITSSPGSVSLINRAPHPNAAKVLINWLLSREGQIAVQKLGDPNDPPNSRRMDIAKDEIAPHLRLVPGRKYLDIGHPSLSDMKPVLQLIKEAGDQKGGR